MFDARRIDSRDFSRRHGMGGPAANEYGTPLPYVWSLAGPEGAHFHFFVPQDVPEGVQRSLIQQSLQVARQESDLVDWSWGPIPEDFEEDPVSSTTEQFHKVDPSMKGHDADTDRPYVIIEVEGLNDRTHMWRRQVPVEFKSSEERVQIMKTVAEEASVRPLRFLEVEIDGTPSVRELALDAWTASTMNQFYRALNEKNKRRWFGGSWPAIFNMFFRLLEREGGKNVDNG